MSTTKRKSTSTGSRVQTRTTTTRTTRLTSQTSEFHSGVTLFKLEEPEVDANLSIETEEDASPSRHKRVKLEINDLEDVASPPRARAQATPRTRRSGLQSVSKSEKDVEKQNLHGSLPISSSSEPSSTSNADFKSPKKGPKPSTSSPSKGKTKAIPQSLDVPHPAPSNWRETYNTIKSMRSRFVAPVDTMGCDQAQLKELDPKNRRYSTLVSLMLSSQTKDEVTDAAVSKLRTALGGSISVAAMIATEDAAISDAIAKVGFWRRKTGYLKQAALKLRDEFDSDVPKTVDELCSLPGVGPKMAFLALQIAWGLNHGIGVDVHVHRITNLLGWHKPPTKNPEQTRLNLQSWLPKELHGEINHILVGFGQVVCLPVSPRCDVCELSAKGLCPSARKVVKVSKNRKEIVFSKVEGDAGEGSLPKVEIALEEKVEEAGGMVGDV